MLASLGKPREEQRDRLLSGSPKLYENSEEQRVSKKPQSPKLYENSEEQRVSKKPQSPKLYEDVKQIVQDTLPQTHYDMKGCTILTFKEDLPLLKEKITEYFDNFKQVG
ncbi:hypothetical protein TVAG_396910 [Trichomonas vaginalis G3]|uniref:Uncharacterized protein n=1 Tax=Trichomonas vaginalis (strain ATCC PRA-98 / G3) TaxID=412133 RepID=A2DX79_TRIV3|nr:hypothetical protein TVAGG3_0673460 [Trichomonas vaginalis G3]EAY14961.1 hypothetical protein TVAG_396910 [Trichomonas vaginalis G3]KAI5507368.1 hypothetical protein TVAGG3_0673460 [Trichomonas vaginalis G3]|eukprot:XP_001327184.1 hypothetical protein [Trichomonas vaginalis G3]